MNLWAAQWRSESLLDGITKHILYGDDCLPALFRTRKECREFIQERWGYIADRLDLQKEPFGWQMPLPVKVEIITLKNESNHD